MAKKMTSTFTKNDLLNMAIANFWEQIFPNLAGIPTERRASIYKRAKAKTLKSISMAELENQPVSPNLGRPRNVK